MGEQRTQIQTRGIRSIDVKVLKRELQRADDTEARYQEIRIKTSDVKHTLEAQYEWLQQQLQLFSARTAM